jgi:hypothetical protein
MLCFFFFRIRSHPQVHNDIQLNWLQPWWLQKPRPCLTTLTDWFNPNPQNKPTVILKVKGKKFQKLQVKWVRTKSKFGRFNQKLMMTTQMVHIFSLSILSKKQQTKKGFLCNKWVHFRDAKFRKQKLNLACSFTQLVFISFLCLCH